MSCNGCRILRKGCSDDCILRQSLTGIENPNAQANATVFLSKFFGRAGLTSFLSSVPQSQRPALFKSLLYEACGRTINPVDGAVGLLGTGKWNLCQAAVDTVLRGGVPRPLSHCSSSHETGQAASSVESSRYNSNLFVNSRLFRSSRSDLNLLLGPSKRKARDDHQGGAKKAVGNESTTGAVMDDLLGCDIMSRGRANDDPRLIRTASPASDKSEMINSEGCDRSFGGNHRRRDSKGIIIGEDRSAGEPELLRLFY